MPRRQQAPRNPPNIFCTHAHSLSEGSKRVLLECLGYPDLDLRAEAIAHQHPGKKLLSHEPGGPLRLAPDPDPIDETKKTNVGAALLGVEQWLGFYIHGANHLDEVPRPSDYVATFKPISQQALQLIEAVADLSDYYCDELVLHGKDADAIVKTLVELHSVSNCIVQEYTGKPSAGAKKHTGLADVVRQLRIIFRSNYKGPITGRKIKGAVQKRSDIEEAEFRFVETALLDVPNMNHNRSVIRQLSSLFRDQRCEVPSEWPATTKPDVKKAKRVRRQKGGG